MSVVRVIETETHWRLKSPLSAHGELDFPRDGRWKFNGDLENPTFTPSMNESWNRPDGTPQRNHFIVTNGRVQFTDDCTHELKGQSVDLPAFSEVEVELARQEQA